MKKQDKYHRMALDINATLYNDYFKWKNIFNHCLLMFDSNEWNG